MRLTLLAILTIVVVLGLGLAVPRVIETVGRIKYERDYGIHPINAPPKPGPPAPSEPLQEPAEPEWMATEMAPSPTNAAWQAGSDADKLATAAKWVEVRRSMTGDSRARPVRDGRYYERLKEIAKKVVDCVDTSLREHTPTVHGLGGTCLTALRM